MKRWLRKAKKGVVYVVILSLVFSSASLVFGQEPPTRGRVVSDGDIIERLIEKVDIEYGHQIAKNVSLMGSGEMGFRTAGSKGERDAAAYLVEEMRKQGLSNL